MLCIYNLFHAYVYMIIYVYPRNILGCVEEVIRDPSMYTKDREKKNRRSFNWGGSPSC